MRKKIIAQPNEVLKVQMESLFLFLFPNIHTCGPACILDNDFHITTIHFCRINVVFIGHREEKPPGMQKIAVNFVNH